MLNALRRIVRRLGPGLVTGASDDDPSGIATYSQAGAQFGYGMLWTLLLTIPLMAAVQEVSARLARITGQGLAANLRRRYPRPLLQGLIVLLVVANTLNLGADLGAMGEAATLLLGGTPLIYTAALTLLSLALELRLPYTSYSKVLKWTTLVLLTYVAAAWFVDIDWTEALRRTLLPSLALRRDSLMTLVAVLGTTISPYLLFWQASEEVEELETTPGKTTLKKAPRQAPGELRRIRFDTVSGMAFSNLVGYFIMLTVAGTLHGPGPPKIETAAQAAEALRPLAGALAPALFSLGILGTGLLAVPILAGSSAYAVSELMQWPEGLQKPPRQAGKFYGVIALGMLIGLALNLFRINPVRALFWSALVNGLVAVPVLALVMRLASDPRIVGQFTLPRGLRILGWLTTLSMAAAAATLLFFLVRGGGAGAAS